MRPIASLAYRLAVFYSLGMLAAGCSNTGTSSVATVPGAASTQTTARGNALAYHQAADGLVKPPARSANTRTGWISPDVTTHKPALIYWGDDSNSTIDIFSAKGINPPLKGTITTGLSNPERLFVDAALNVYATNNGTGNGDITAYKRGATSPFLTISNGIDDPTGITVDSAGTVYCANVGNNTITEYPKGHTLPSVTITMPPSNTPEYLAVDRADNLYVATLGTGVWEFARGSTTGKNLGLSVAFPDGIEVDKNGNIIVIDSSGLAIDVFPPGQATPSKTIPVTAGSPFALSLNKSETKLYVSVLVSGNFILQTLAYPNGATLANKITTSDGQWPVAVSPDAVL